MGSSPIPPAGKAPPGPPSNGGARGRRAGLSLRARLRLGLSVIAAALAILAAGAVASLDRLGGAVATILQENYASVIFCEDMKEALERQDSAALFAATGRRDIAEPMLLHNRTIFAEALAGEDRNITLAGEGDLVREIHARYEDYLRAVDRALALPQAEQLDAYFRELLPRFTTIKDRIQAVLRLNQANMEAEDHRAKDLARRMVRAGIAASVITVLFAVWFAFWLSRSIARPVEALTQSAREIGEGNLDVSVDRPDIAELVALSGAFNRMAERLRAYRESSLGELLAAKDLARATLACMLDPVIVLDPAGGVLLANEAAEAAFGVEVGAADELAAREVSIPEEIAAARDRVLSTGEAVLPRSLSEAMHWRGAEGERYYLVRAAPLRTAPKDRPSAIVAAQDVTRFHRIDELKSDMVATVSHEFKTPLTSLRMATHLLLEPGTGPLTEAQRELVTTARDDTERLRAMVEDLLDVVRIEAEVGALHRVPVEPFGLLCEVADAHRTLARDKEVTLEVEPAAQQGLVELDPERLGIALANLVSNAIRHTPRGGRVVLSEARDDKTIRIQVRDNGEGIDPAMLPRIFDRAVTAGAGPRSSPDGAAGPRSSDAPASADGSGRHGLGLGIAREIVLQHGGDLLVESEPGKGSVFTLVVPTDAEA
jgi:signal transduction histidine kinase/HAMP domain-containing protein